jgi:hypothetical protein
LTEQTTEPQAEPSLYRASVDAFTAAAKECSTPEDLAQLLTAYGHITAGLTQALEIGVIKTLFPGEPSIRLRDVPDRLADSLPDTPHPTDFVALLQSVLRAGTANSAPAFVAATILRDHQQAQAE